MKIYFLTLLCISLSFVSFAQSNSQTEEDAAFEPISETLNAESIFDSNEPLEITLKYDITSFNRKKSKGEYLDAEFRFICLKPIR